MTGVSLRAWMTAVLVAALGLTGCGGDTGPTRPAPAGSDATSSSTPSPSGPAAESSSAPITDPAVAVALVAPHMRDGRFTAPVDYEQATCLAEHLVDDLGPMGAVELSRVVDVDRLSRAQRSRLTLALDACLPMSQLAAPTSAAVLEAFGLPNRPDPRMTRCLTIALDGHVGDLMLTENTYEEGDPPPAYVVEALSRCTPRDVLVEAFARGFREPGISTAEARCAAEVVVDGVSLAELVRVGMSGRQPPPDVLSVFEDAFRRCSTGAA